MEQLQYILPKMQWLLCKVTIRELEIIFVNIILAIFQMKIL